jgi:hypothetical protein
MEQSYIHVFLLKLEERLKNLSFSPLQIKLIADGLKEIGSGIMITLLIAMIIEQRMDILVGFKGLISFFALWYTALTLVSRVDS